MSIIRSPILPATLPILLSLSLSLVLFTSCKTTAEIKREKKMEDVTMQVSQGQQVIADTTAQIKTLEENLSKLTGLVEESRYLKDNKDKKLQESLHNNLKLFEERIAKLETENSEMKLLLEQQKEYITEVVSSLEKIATIKKPAEKTDTSPAPSLQVTFETCKKSFKEEKYKESIAHCDAILSGKSLSVKEQAQALHHLGVSYNKVKKHTEALAPLSTLYADFSKSSFVASGLLHLAKSLLALKKKEEAIQALETLLADFPKSKFAKEATTLLSKVKK